MARLVRDCCVALILLTTCVHCRLILNGTEAVGETRNHREGKYLVFPRGGNVRMIVGFLCPMFIPKWQNINVLNNWSIGFSVPQKNSDWYQKLTGNSNWRTRQSRLLEKGDDTRARFYRFLAKTFESHGRDGRECVLRMICQVAEAPIAHNGLIGELFHVVFTPNEGEQLEDDDYMSAKKAGIHGADCQEIYPNCPHGHSPLDKFSVLGLMTAKNFLDVFL